MTERDHVGRLAGYYPSAWPAECAGPRRQKVTRAPGLALKPGETLTARSRAMEPGLWPVMFVQRDPGELYLQGGTQFGQTTDSHGWVEQLDPISLEAVRRSPPLPSGGHNWCGAICVHENGDLYVVNGSYCHRLSPDLAVVAEHRLAADRFHNGHVVLSDGNIVMKDLTDDPASPSVFTVLDPDLKLVDRYSFPWASVGRFSADRQDGADHLYVTHATEIRRLIYAGGRLRLDETWAARYAIPGEDQSFAWDSCIAGDCAWFMDMGENVDSRFAIAQRPTGSRRPPLRDPWGAPFGPPIHNAPQRVFRVSVDDAADMDAFVPFGDAGGHIISPPLYDQDRRILVAFDSMNGRLGAWRYRAPGDYEPLWRRDWMTSNQLTVYADTGELIVDHVHEFGAWDAVVLDIETGAERGRAETGCIMPTGMWFTPGFDRDFYISNQLGRIGRISVA